MRKSIGGKFASITIETTDDKKLNSRLEKLLADFDIKARRAMSSEEFDLFAAYLLYCSYVSRNAPFLRLKNYDEQFGIDDAERNLGEKYLAKDFLAHYSSLESNLVKLPALEHVSAGVDEAAALIKIWAQLLRKSELSLLENKEYSVAKAIFDLLFGGTRIDRYGRIGSEFGSYRCVAKLVTRLVGVEGMTVLDFACGEGVFLGEAAMGGAKAVAGADVNLRSVEWAKLSAFFAAPDCPASFEVKDAAQEGCGESARFDRVLLAPPLAMRLRDRTPKVREVLEETYSSLGGDTPFMSLQFEDFCAAKAIESLNNEGIAVVQVAAGFLFQQQKDRQALRKTLLEKGNVLAVIELPGGAQPGTTVKTALLVLTKKRRFDDVLILDLDSKEIAGADYFAKQRSRGFSISDEGIEWICDVVEKRREIPRVSVLVSSEKIAENEANLCFSAYGEVFDLEASLVGVRSAGDVVEEIKKVQKEIFAMGETIEELIVSLDQVSGKEH